MVVMDGASGMRRAVQTCWPTTRIRRCLFHVQHQVLRATTRNPRLPAGNALAGLAYALGKVTNLAGADAWVTAYGTWLMIYVAFLDETTWHADGYVRDKHQRLVRARGQLNRLLQQGELFTFLDPALTDGQVWAKTTSALEGGINAQLRALLFHHRGMRLSRRLKALSWWCYLHTGLAYPSAATLQTMLTDTDLTTSGQPDNPYTTDTGYGTAVLYHELQTPTPNITTQHERPFTHQHKLAYNPSIQVTGFPTAQPRTSGRPGWGGG